MKNKKTLFLGSLIFIIVFCIFSFSIKSNWFFMDDLGIIINGLIKNFSDFIRVFTDDMRNYAVTYNFKSPKSNVISGFLRPMQNLFFSITYHLFGLNPYAYYLLQTFFHAINASLIFIIFSYWLPLELSFFGGLFYAFFPGQSWMLWLCSLQHNLSLFFFLLSALLFIKWHKNQKNYLLCISSGISFLLSLLSRETHIFHIFWIFLIIYIFDSSKNTKFIYKIKNSISKTWIFFFSAFIYFLMRLYSFGIESLWRTINNRFIQFPFLKKLPFISSLATNYVPEVSSHALANITPATHIAINNIQNIQPQLWEKIFTKFQATFFKWSEVILNIPQINKTSIILAWILLISFFYFAYKSNRKIMFFFLFSILFFIWPSLITYPAQRYLHAAYPFFIFIILYGINLMIKKSGKSLFEIIILACIITFISISFTKSFYSNFRSLLNTKANKEGSTHYKLFQENKFKKGTHFIVLSVPLESDMEQIFQVHGNDPTIKVAYEIISTIASDGFQECTGGYQMSYVKSKVKPIENGFRFISLDKRCAWNLHAYQPVRWSNDEYAYVLHPEPFKKNTWHEFSMGKFIINKITPQYYATDISYVFNKKYLIPNTVFVHWDTNDGKYKVLNSSHIKLCKN